MRKLLLTGVALAGCAGSVRSIDAPYLHSSAVTSPRPPVLDLAIDPSLEILRLPPLGSVSLPPGYRELRLSRGHGMILGAEYPVVRVLECFDTVTGEIIRFRGRPDSSAHAVKWTARSVRPAHRVDWRRLLQHLDSLGVGELTPPRYRSAINDAGDLVVEVRRGTEYVVYEVNAPQLRDDTVSWRAAKIAAVVDSMERLTRGYE